MSRGSLAPPRTIGPYVLRRALGKGGMAETWLAVRRGAGKFERECCIKRLLPERASEREHVRRFEREVLLHAQLRHDNIVTAEDAGIDPELGHYLVLEYVHGIDLGQLLAHCAQGARLPTDVAAYIAAQTAEGLFYMHELTVDGTQMGLIHRDLSTGNILLSEHGHVKVIDFGLSLHRETVKITATDSIPGNIRFLSPEHFKRERLSAQSDIFALGIVLYLMLTGEHPFTSANEAHAGMLAGNANAVLAHPAALQDAGVPDDLAQLVRQMLAKDPSDRPETAERVAERLDSHYRQYSARVRLSLFVREAREAADERKSERESDDGIDEEEEGQVATAVTTSTQTRRLRFTWPRTATAVAVTSVVLGGAFYAFRFNPSTSSEGTATTDRTTASAVFFADAAIANDMLTKAVAPSVPSNAEEPRVEILADAGRAQAAAPAVTTGSSRSALHVSVSAGCIFLDGKARGEHDVKLTELPPGHHVIGLAPSCQGPIDETHSVVLAPGGIKRKKYAYMKGVDF